MDKIKRTETAKSLHYYRRMAALARAKRNRIREREQLTNLGD